MSTTTKAGTTTTKAGTTITKAGTTTVSPSTTTTKAGTTTTFSPSTTTTAIPQCPAAFQKYMLLFNDTIATLGQIQSTFTDVYAQFKRYGDPNELGCLPLKGGKLSRKNSSNKRKSHTRKWRV
jgi:hypothetical protein